MKYIIAAFALMISSLSFADCPLGVRMIDAYGGQFESETLKLIQEGLTPKGYNVFEINFSDTDTDLIIEVLSDGISGGESNAASFALGYTFDARFESTKSKTIFSKFSRQNRALIPYLTDVSENRRRKTFLKVTRDLLSKIKPCDQLDTDMNTNP